MFQSRLRNSALHLTKRPDDDVSVSGELLQLYCHEQFQVNEESLEEELRMAESFKSIQVIETSEEATRISSNNPSVILAPNV